MSATQSSSQTISHANGDALPAMPSVEIDASCRAPLLLLFISAAIWLLLGSLLGFVATLKFHAPNLLSDCASMTYGRVHPAHLNALIYGFAIPAGLGVVLWIIAHLGRNRLMMAPVIMGGTILWNLGLSLGILGILLGDSTGFEWLEMPRYASLMLFFGYLAIGAGAMVTFHERRERQLYTSHWFLIAALFWFPWVYSTVNFLLVGKPVRGVLQAVLDGWYINNLSTVWFGCLGLGSIFYFIPKMTKHPLYSHGLGLFAFWGLIIFGSWGGIAPGAPMPAWMSALSTVAAVLTIVPILTVPWNIKQTVAGDCSGATERAPFHFILFGSLAFVTSGLVAPLVSLRRVSAITHFTWFVPAQTQWMLYGFFAMTMFGAIYYILPRITGVEFCSRKMLTWHFWLAAFGILIYALPLALGGIQQGLAMSDQNRSFADIMVGSLMYLRLSTTGDLLMLVGHLIFLLNLAGMLNTMRRNFTVAFLADNVKTVGVPS